MIITLKHTAAATIQYFNRVEEQVSLTMLAHSFQNVHLLM